MIDYERYYFTPKERLAEVCRATAICLFTGWLFLGSWKGSLLLLPASVLIIRETKRKKTEKRLQILRDDFKEFVISFSSSVQAGYTIEQAVLEGIDDLKRGTAAGERMMLRELEWMEQQMRLKVSCDVLFADLARRSGLEEIRSFSVVLTVGKRQGGNLVQISRKAALHIARKIQVQKEVEQTTAGRVMEKNIMACMPFFMILYLRITNGTYIGILYDSFYGKCIMATALLVFWISKRWADRIVGIRL